MGELMLFTFVILGCAICIITFYQYLKVKENNEHKIPFK